MEETCQAKGIIQGTKAFLNVFKAKAKATDINKLVDVVGRTHTSWQGISELARQFFVNRLSIENTNRAESFDEIFSRVGNTISWFERLPMEELVTIAKLRATANKLAKGKVPGPDEVPVEFYISFWNHVGPLVHESFWKVSAQVNLD